MSSRHRLLTSLSAAVALSVFALPLTARQQPPSQSSQQLPRFEPAVGMPGKDAVWVPTHPTVIEKMLDMARVTEKDFVVDLGSGDGRTVIAAAKRGAKAVGFEYNSDLVEFSRKLATEAGVANRARFVQGDMYQADFSEATVLALFLLPSNLDKLKDKILALKPGTRVVLNTFTAAGWEPDERFRLHGECGAWCEVLLHIVPAKAAGTWRGDRMELELAQDFQKVAGTVLVNGATATIENGRLHGDRLTFSASGTSYISQVNGDQMTGTASTTEPNARRNWTLTRERK